MKLVFSSSTGLSFDERRAVVERIRLNKSVAKLGLTSVAWLGALRMSVHFAQELKPAQLARITKLVRAARLAVVELPVDASPLLRKGEDISSESIAELAREGRASISANGDVRVITDAGAFIVV